jgi:hypothetical protein
VSTIRVDVGALSGTAGHLRSAVAVAREVHRSGRGLAASAADCGSPVLGAAVHDFLGAWAHGMGLVASDADALGAALEQAAAGYRQVEDAVSAAAAPGGRP